MPAVEQPRAEAPEPGGFRQQLDVWCERAILGVVAAIVFWGPLAFGGVPESSFVVVEGLTLVALGLWVVRLWVQRPFCLLWPPICWAVFVFLLYALVRCQFVLLEYPARQELTQIVVYASLFFIVLNNLHRRESITVIAVGLVVLGMVLSWVAVFQFATKYPTIWGYARRGQFINRGSGTYINPNHLAGLLGLTVPLALAYALMSRFNHTAKVFFGYCALAMLAGIGVTVSRGGIVAAGLMLAVFCLVLLFQRGYQVPALGILAVMVALALVFGLEFDSLHKRFAVALLPGHMADARMEYWSAAWKIFKLHPCWGGGPAHFDAEFIAYRPRDVQVRPMYVHNDYLNTLCEYGVVGLAVIAVFCGLLFYGAWKTRPVLRQPDLVAGLSLKSDKAAFLLGACMGLLALLFHSAVDFNMHVPANAIVAIVFMALMSGYWRFVSDGFWRMPRLPCKILLTLVLLAAMAWVGAQGMQSGREAYWQKHGAIETLSDQEHLDALKNAYAAEPSNFVNSYYLGEFYRLASLEGNPGYQDEARQAMQWYDKSMALNPLDPFVPMRHGMCLDWIGETNQSGAYFDQAEKLDPNNYYVAYYVGRHYVDSGDLPAARRWFYRSLEIKWNDMALYAMVGVDERMKDPYGLYKK